MEENKNDSKTYLYRKLNFASADLGIPLYKESKNSNGWINFGQDNLMPEYYLGLLARSPKHSAIVNTKQQLVAGNGWMREDLSAETLLFLKNAYGETDLDEVAARAAFDFEIFGAFALEIIWNKDRQSIKAINHVPAQKVRAKIKDEKHPDEDGYFICNNWKKWANQPILFAQKFSTINRKDANQILYCKRYVPGKETYGEPNYMAAARWCELEYEISNFHLQAAKNGFTPGLHINIPFGSPNEDAIDREVNRLRNEFEGTNNANVPFITFSDGPDNKISIDSIDLNASDQRFIQLNSEITEGIMTGHQVTSPSLFGVMQEGMIVNKNATINDLQQFQAQYITPRQNFIEGVFNRLGSINGCEKIQLNTYELDFDVELNISDLLSIIQAPIPSEQKKQVLITSGYRPDEANRLIDSGEVKEQLPINQSKDFKVVYGNTRTGNNAAVKSSNVWKYKYDDKKEELVIKFQEGETYTYFNVPVETFIELTEGMATCKTSGSNRFGEWYEGKNPSIGAFIHEKLNDYTYTKGGSV